MKVFAVAENKVSVERIEFSPDSSLLVIGAANSGVGPWDWHHGELAYPERSPKFMPGSSAIFHPLGRWLLGTSSSNGLAVYNLETRETFAEPNPQGKEIIHAGFTSDGMTFIYSYLITGKRRALVAREWNSDTRQVRVIWSESFCPGQAGDNMTTGLAPLPDCQRFVTAMAIPESNGRLSIRSVQTGAVIETQAVVGSDLPKLAVDSEGRLFVILMRHRLSVWTASDLAAAPLTIKNPNRKHFTGIAFHPSGRFLAATSNDATVKLYDTTTWYVERSFTWDIGRMRSIAFSPDGMLAAAGSDTGKVVVWDVDE